MANYAIGGARYQGDQLVEVSIQCVDEPDGPFLYECEVAPVAEVVRWIRRGDQVVAVWHGVGSLPVEIVALPGGLETIDTVQRGQPAGYRIENLPPID